MVPRFFFFSGASERLDRLDSQAEGAGAEGRGLESGVLCVCMYVCVYIYVCIYIYMSE
jgi:hypothetical protein